MDKGIKSKHKLVSLTIVFGLLTKPPHQTSLCLQAILDSNQKLP